MSYRVNQSRLGYVCEFCAEIFGVFVWFWAIMIMPLFLGCRTFQVEPEEVFAPSGFSVYAGDPENNGISRAQAGERIACSDEVFGEFICLRADEFRLLVEEIAAARKMRAEP